MHIERVNAAAMASTGCQDIQVCFCGKLCHKGMPWVISPCYFNIVGRSVCVRGLQQLVADRHPSQTAPQHRLYSLQPHSTHRTVLL